MSSLDIAALTGKRHDHVLRDIETTLEAAQIGAPKFGGTYLDSQNKERPCYFLPRYECDLVVSGYSVPYRAAIIKRWHELEAEKAAPQFRVPASYAEALQLAADQALLLESKTAELAEAQPKLEYHARVMSSDSLFGFREVAALLAEKGIGSTNLVRRLEAMGVLYHEKRGEKKGHVMAKAQYVSAGYFKCIERAYEVKELGGIPTGETKVSATLKVTVKGVEFIAKKLEGGAS